MKNLYEFSVFENKKEQLEARPLHEIAADISHDWKNVDYAAKPYLEAMYSLDKITDKYIMDSGRSIVLYFLANASKWRGPIAQDIKKELKIMLDQ